MSPSPGHPLPCSWNLTVKNPDGKVYKATNIFTVKNPVPAITTFTPISITHGSPGFTLNIYRKQLRPDKQDLLPGNCQTNRLDLAQKSERNHSLQ